ncbi:uncharacterized protein ACIB01_001540 [Guaruba guarouba]
MQPKAGGKLHLRLNTGTRPIANKYRKGVEKNFEERVQEGVKPLRGKRVGPAQSARRIQPGEFAAGRRGSGGSPPPPPLRPPGHPPAGAGRGGGPARGPPPGRRPALAGRISSAAVRRDRLRVGWEGLRRAGGPAPRERRPGVRAPGQQVSPNPGAEGEDRRRALPRPGGAGPPPAWRGVVRGPPGSGGRARRPPAPLSTGADCAQCAPTARRRRAVRGRARAPGVRGDVGYPPDPS